MVRGRGSQPRRSDERRITEARGGRREREREKKRGCSLGERAIIARNIIPG